MPPAATVGLDEVLRAYPMRAGQFIVTLYGDVAVPRGGGLWVGDIIATCAPLGISETLVRTAMSRLVTAGQLQGVRKGRRSFYRLTEQAESEYLRAADRIYDSPVNKMWRLLWFPASDAEARLATMPDIGFQIIVPSFAFGPAQGAIPDGAVSISAPAEGNEADLRAMGATLWPLDDLSRAYEDFLLVASHLSTHPPGTAAQALLHRLLLVHQFRAIALMDPFLPAPALPSDWAGHRARTRFAEDYLALSEVADSHVASAFEGYSGPLPIRSPEAEGRLKRLQDWLESYVL